MILFKILIDALKWSFIYFIIKFKKQIANLNTIFPNFRIKKVKMNMFQGIEKLLLNFRVFFNGFKIFTQ